MTKLPICNPKKSFRDNLAKAPDDKARMDIIVKEFNWSGIVNHHDNVVATYYIAAALASLLEKKNV